MKLGLESATDLHDLHASNSGGRGQWLGGGTMASVEHEPITGSGADIYLFYVYESSLV